MIRRILGFTLTALVAATVITLAQVNTGVQPHVFTFRTVADQNQVNANFARIFADALDRTGGTMTGTLLFSPDNTIDLGASGANRPRRAYVGTEVISPLFTGNLVGNVTGSISGGTVAGTTGTFSDAITGASLTITGTARIGSGGTTTQFRRPDDTGNLVSWGNDGNMFQYGAVHQTRNAAGDTIFTDARSDGFGWGGGSRISSSNNVAVLSGQTNTFTGSTNGTRSVDLVNTSTGAAAITRFGMTNNESGVRGDLVMHGSGFSTSGFNIADSLRLTSWGAGGLTLRASAGDLRLASGSSTGATLTASAFSPAVVVRGADGSVSAPAFSFTSETGLGIYRVTSGALGVAVGGSNVLDVRADGLGWGGGARIPSSSGLLSYPIVLTGMDATYTLFNSSSPYNAYSVGTMNVLVASPNGGAVVVNGITATSQVDGRWLRIYNNATSDTLTLSHESGSATAANRFVIRGGSDLVLAAGEYVDLFYSTSRWRYYGSAK